jgi:phosphoribosylaminoimidazole carboxylase (NCAIR synthetase)
MAGATLGVMGGGQLGRMFVQAAQAMGYFTAVLDPDARPAPPAWWRTITSTPTTLTSRAWPS